jgi:hypothetical protein
MLLIEWAMLMRFMLKEDEKDYLAYRYLAPPHKRLIGLLPGKIQLQGKYGVIKAFEDESLDI